MSSIPDEFDLACALDELPQSQISQRPQSDELTRYLDSSKYPLISLEQLLIHLLDIVKNAQPLTWWRDHQDEFPTMAKIARDVLSIPANGAGVERLFNSARDVCHYRRGSLQPQTISDLMMYMCTSRFEIHEEERIMLSEYLSTQEIQAAKEERTPQQLAVDPISDNEEDEGSTIQLQARSQPRATSQALTTLQTTQGLSAKALGKRRLSNIASDVGDDEEDDGQDSEAIPLPEIQNRVSGRVRKRSRLLDGYEMSNM
jgi:hypothetical protein